MKLSTSSRMTMCDNSSTSIISDAMCASGILSDSLDYLMSDPEVSRTVNLILVSAVIYLTSLGRCYSDFVKTHTFLNVCRDTLASHIGKRVHPV